MKTEYLVTLSNKDYGHGYDHCAIVAESEAEAEAIAREYDPAATKIEIADNGWAPEGAKTGVQDKASFEK